MSLKSFQSSQGKQAETWRSLIFKRSWVLSSRGIIQVIQADIWIGISSCDTGGSRSNLGGVGGSALFRELSSFARRAVILLYKCQQSTARRPNPAHHLLFNIYLFLLIDDCFPPPVFANNVLLEHSHTCPIHILSMATFALLDRVKLSL